MKIRSGIDFCKIDRLTKHLEDGPDHFIERCFTENEIRYCLSHNSIDRQSECFAARFAAKEAGSKALGTGVCTDNIGFKDFEVIKDDKGAPELALYGRAKEIAESLGVCSISVSLTHESGIAAAFVQMLTNEEC